MGTESRTATAYRLSNTECTDIHDFFDKLPKKRKLWDEAEIVGFVSDNLFSLTCDKVSTYRFFEMGGEIVAGLYIKQCPGTPVEISLYASDEEMFWGHTGSVGEVVLLD